MSTARTGATIHCKEVSIGMSIVLIIGPFCVQRGHFHSQLCLLNHVRPVGTHAFSMKADAGGKVLDIRNLMLMPHIHWDQDVAMSCPSGKVHPSSNF
eukprot:2456693-Karenia_brevis.AAC.1